VELDSGFGQEAGGRKRSKSDGSRSDEAGGRGVVAAAKGFSGMGLVSGEGCALCFRSGRTYGWFSTRGFSTPPTRRQGRGDSRGGASTAVMGDPVGGEGPFRCPDHSFRSRTQASLSTAVPAGGVCFRRAEVVFGGAASFGVGAEGDRRFRSMLTAGGSNYGEQ